jgi:N-acetylmuramic acid 6-phosphate etherase
MSTIPDRAHILTEQQNPHAAGLHRLDAAGIVALFNRENHAVLAALEYAAPALSAFIAAIEPGFLRGGRLIYLGAGTSGRLAVLDASEIPPTFQMPPERIIGLIAGGDGSLRRSSEGKEDEPHGAIPELLALKLNADDTVLGIAAGGTTPYVQGALAWAKELPHPPHTGLLSCAPLACPSGCDHLIVLSTGPEIVTGSTRLKAGTATKLALNTISTALMVRLGKVYGNLMVDVRASNVKLRDRAARIISTLTDANRDEALDLLDAADGQVKVAVVMRRKSVDADGARTILSEADGHLARLLDP